MFYAKAHTLVFSVQKNTDLCANDLRVKPLSKCVFRFRSRLLRFTDTVNFQIHRKLDVRTRFPVHSAFHRLLSQEPFHRYTRKTMPRRVSSVAIAAHTPSKP